MPAAAPAPAAPARNGIRVYLSQVKEWILECGCDTLFLSIRTDTAWYRLMQPAAAYSPWYTPVVKSARVAISVLSMLADESRAARLNLDQVVKRLAEQEPGSATFVGSTPAQAEQFLTIHGQILLNQFRTFPLKCADRTALRWRGVAGSAGGCPRRGCCDSNS